MVTEGAREVKPLKTGHLNALRQRWARPWAPCSLELPGEPALLARFLGGGALMTDWPAGPEAIVAETMQWAIGTSLAALHHLGVGSDEQPVRLAEPRLEARICVSSLLAHARSHQHVDRQDRYHYQRQKQGRSDAHGSIARREKREAEEEDSSE